MGKFAKASADGSCATAGPGGGPHTHPISDVTDLQTALDGKAASAVVTDHVALSDPHTQYQKKSEKAQANGYASLGADGKVPSAQLPSSGAGYHDTIMSPVGLNPANGDLLWQHPHQCDWGLNITPPLWGEGNILFVSSAYSGGSRALQLNQSGGKTTVKELWANRRMRIHHGTMLRLGDLVFGSSGDFGPAPMTAVEIKTGNIVWQVPLGEDPAFKKTGIANSGSFNRGGGIATAGGLIFIGATHDNMFRAFDQKTGKVLWEYQLPGTASSIPSTYAVGDKQYVVVSVNGEGDFRGGYIAFAIR